VCTGGGCTVTVFGGTGASSGACPVRVAPGTAPVAGWRLDSNEVRSDVPPFFTISISPANVRMYFSGSLPGVAFGVVEDASITLIVPSVGNVSILRKPPKSDLMVDKVLIAEGYQP